MEKLVTFFEKSPSCCFCTLRCLRAARRLNSCFNIYLTGWWRQLFLLMVIPEICHVCVSSFRSVQIKPICGLCGDCAGKVRSHLINITGPLLPSSHVVPCDALVSDRGDTWLTAAAWPSQIDHRGSQWKWTENTAFSHGSIRFGATSQWHVRWGGTSEPATCPFSIFQLKNRKTTQQKWQINY